MQLVSLCHALLSQAESLDIASTSRINARLMYPQHCFCFYSHCCQSAVAVCSGHCPARKGSGCKPCLYLGTKVGQDTVQGSSQSHQINAVCKMWQYHQFLTASALSMMEEMRHLYEVDGVRGEQFYEGWRDLFHLSCPIHDFIQ